MASPCVRRAGQCLLCGPIPTVSSWRAADAGLGANAIRKAKLERPASGVQRGGRGTPAEPSKRRGRRDVGRVEAVVCGLTRPWRQRLAGLQQQLLERGFNLVDMVQHGGVRPRRIASDDGVHHAVVFLV